MTLADLIAQTSWAQVKAALMLCFPGQHPELRNWQQVFRVLRRMKPEPNSMRISIEPGSPLLPEDGPTLEVVGRNGTLNRELDDFSHLGEQATPHYGAQEVIWSLALTPWRQWLGMTIEPTTLAAFTAPQILAHCLNELTFHGFSEGDVRAVADDLDRRVKELEAMSEEERAEKLIPAEKVLAELKAKLDADK